MGVELDRPAVYLCPTAYCPPLLQMAVGLIAEMGKRYGNVGVFRPIVAASSGDRVLSAALEQASAASDVQHWGATADELLHNPGQALANIVARYAECSQAYDAVLVLGSDYDCQLAPIELAWNIRIAANLNVPLALAVPSEGNAEAVTRRAEVAIHEATENYAQVVAVLTVLGADQKLTADQLGELPVPVFVIEDLSSGSSSLAEVCAALGARVVAGPEELSGVAATELIVADMSMANLLGLLHTDSTVVFAADRSDIALGVAIGATSGKFPKPTAAIAAGPWRMRDEIAPLWSSLLGNVPLLRTERSSEQVSRAWHSRDKSPTRLSPAQVAAAQRIFSSQVDAGVLLDRPNAIGRDDVVTPMMFEHRLLEDARRADQHIVLPEGEEERILRAAHRLLEQKICRLTLLGDVAKIKSLASSLSLDISAADIIDPRTSELRERFAAKYAELRAKKGITLDQARERMLDVSYFGTMMVYDGLADGMVSGAVNTTAHTIRPSLEVIKTKPGVSVVSSVFLMCLPDRVMVFGDCAVNPNPTPEQVADIAISSAETARQFGVEPRVAMLSYSTGTSGTGPDVEQTIEATRLVKERAPELAVDGPLQYDAAVEPSVARTKLPDSPVAGKATVLIFPDLQTGNNTYKAVQRSAGALAVGPVLQGLNKPVNDLSRGALVSDIVNTVAITAIQAGMA